MRLMVAYDGSEGSRAALREAATLARETGSPVVVVQVLNPLVDAANVVAPTTAEAMKTVVAETRAALEAAASEFDLAAGTEFVAEPVKRGEDAAEALERIAGEQSATMLVISSRRAASVVGTLLGSVTSHVIRHAPCPVLVVRE